jgi:hypothetical protein
MANKLRRRRRDVFDRMLAWAHRLLNPPVPATVRVGRPRRERDRVPI